VRERWWDGKLCVWDRQIMIIYLKFKSSLSYLISHSSLFFSIRRWWWKSKTRRRDQIIIIYINQLSLSLSCLCLLTSQKRKKKEINKIRIQSNLIKMHCCFWMVVWIIFKDYFIFFFSLFFSYHHHNKKDVEKRKMIKKRWWRWRRDCWSFSLSSYDCAFFALLNEVVEIWNW